MITNIENKLRNIIQEREEKIKPENIKEGVSILGVEGVLHGNANIISTTDNNIQALGATLIINELSYIELEYIESTGTQYIDTEFKHNQDTRVVADLDVSSSQINQYVDLFGSWGNVTSARRMFGIELTQSDASSSDAYYGNGQRYGFGNVVGRKIYDFNRNVFKIDSLSYTYTTETFQSLYNFLIFVTTGYTGSIPDIRAVMKLYSFKIYLADNLIRDFIPVKRIIDEEICLYDKVTKAFFTNAGTGTFIAGPIKE